MDFDSGSFTIEFVIGKNHLCFSAGQALLSGSANGLERGTVPCSLKQLSQKALRHLVLISQCAMDQFGDEMLYENEVESVGCLLRSGQPPNRFS